MSTNFAKTLVWKHEYDVNCDITNNGHQIQMTIICNSVKTPTKISCVRHGSRVLAVLTRHSRNSGALALQQRDVILYLETVGEI